MIRFFVKAFKRSFLFRIIGWPVLFIVCFTMGTLLIGIRTAYPDYDQYVPMVVEHIQMYISYTLSPASAIDFWLMNLGMVILGELILMYGRKRDREGRFQYVSQSSSTIYISPLGYSGKQGIDCIYPFLGYHLKLGDFKFFDDGKLTAYQVAGVAPVVAVHDGNVVEVIKRKKNALVRIDHGLFFTIYAGFDLSTLTLRKKQRVLKGALLGYCAYPGVNGAAGAMQNQSAHMLFTVRHWKGDKIYLERIKTDEELRQEAIAKQQRETQRRNEITLQNTTHQHLYHNFKQPISIRLIK